MDVVDDLGWPTGEVVWKSEAHSRGLPHRCSHCWVWGTDESDEAYLLVQRRAATKDTWPGRLDVTAAGHLAAGEGPLGGSLRELQEELGLSVEPGRLVPLGSRWVELEIPQGRDREFHHVFLLFDRTPPGELRLQKEEVEAVLSLRLEDAGALESGGSVPTLEYAGGGAATGRARLADFVPNGDDYVRRVARAACRLRAGGDPGEVF